MAEDHGASEAGDYPGPEAEVIERQRVAKERAEQRFRTEQHEMRGVLGRMTAGAA